MTNALTRRSLLAAAGGGAALGALPRRLSAQGAIDLNFVVWNYSLDTIQDNIAKFEAANPGVKVTLTDYTWKDYFDTMVLRFRGSTPTQVMYCGEDWLPGWALAGWLVPIEDKFPEIAKYKDKIANYAVRDMTYNGKLYGLPYYADLITFQYNAKILADHGIAMPQDWDQVLAACLKLKQAGMEKPFVYEYDQTLPNFYQAFVSQVYGRGGRMFDDNLEPLFNDPNSEAFKHLQWLQDAVTKHEIVAFESHETRVIPAMNTGKHAFSVLFNYVLAAMNEKATQPLAGQFAMGLMPGSAHACLGFCKFFAMTSQAAADPARSRGELEIHRVHGRRRLPGRQALGGGERPRLRAAAAVRRSRCAEGLVGLDRCRDVQDPGRPRRQRHPDRVARHVERLFPTADGQGLRRRGERGRGHGRWRETLARAAEARPRGVTGGTDRRAARASAGPGATADDDARRALRRLAGCCRRCCSCCCSRSTPWRTRSTAASTR